jgi:hypothetical protein
MPFKLNLLIDSLVVSAIFFSGCFVTSMFYKGKAQKIEIAQMAANESFIKAQNEKSVKVESELADAKLKTADLTKRLGKFHAKNHTNCKLPPDAVMLLRDASSK